METKAELCYLARMAVVYLDEILKIPAMERLRIAPAIWNSVAEQPDHVPLIPAQAGELDARYADYLEHPADGVTWDVAKAQILRSP